MDLMKRNKGWLKVVLGLVCGLVYMGVVILMNQPKDGQVATAASQVMFAKGHVLQVLKDQGLPDTWTEGLRLGSQEVVIGIDSGAYKGLNLNATNYLGAYGNVDVVQGTKVILRMDKNDQGQPYIVNVVNYDRSMALTFLVVVFVGALVIFGGKKGVASVLGLMFTMLNIWFLLIPMMERGVPAILAAILIVAITTTVALLLITGWSSKTFIAAVGCIIGVSIAGIMAAIVGHLTPINGFNMAEAEDLVLRTGSEGLKISGLLVAGILISSLGAVMDMAMSIASAVTELRLLKPKATRQELFKSGLTIGRDTMGTMANTLILAFAGASLNMLVLFRVFDYPTLQIMNSDMMTLELIQGLTGAIGIVLTVPVVAGLSAFVYTKKSPKNN